MTVQLAYPLPAGNHFVSLTQSGPAFACTPPAVGAGGTVNCNIATLANGATTTFTLTVDTVGLIGGTVANTASASSSTGDANPANNTAAANVALASSPPVPAPMLRWPALLLLIALLAAIAMTQRRVNRSERR